MPYKKKSKAFSAVTAVKSAARKAIGAPPPTRRAPDEKTKAKQKRAKYKPTIEKLVSDEE